MPDGISHGERWIDVNLTEQKLIAFEGLIPVFEELVSTGTTNHPTVTGQFRIWLRFQSQDMDGYRLGYDYYLKGVPYVQYFYEDYALHGTFWHSNFGTPMSHGCVNLSPAAAEWLYNWAGYGTLVNIHP
jgi:lipoprotein-anchoring transpeptidase ErfK/SrfK